MSFWALLKWKPKVNCWKSQSSLSCKVSHFTEVLKKLTAILSWEKIETIWTSNKFSQPKLSNHCSTFFSTRERVCFEKKSFCLARKTKKQFCMEHSFFVWVGVELGRNNKSRLFWREIMVWATVRKFDSSWFFYKNFFLFF